MARVLIAGCGYVGTALGLELHDKGHEVWGLRRSPGGLPTAIRPVAGDLTDASSLSRVPEGVEIVFYLASPSAFTDEAYRTAYVDGLGNLGPNISRARRLFLVTSTGVYGQTQGEWVDETSPTVPKSFAGRRLLEAEAVARRGTLTSTAVRFAGIYGPGRTRLVQSVAESRAIIAPNPVWTNRIHRDDCAGMLAHLMTLGHPDDTYIGVDNEPAERGAVLRWLADELGVAHPPVREVDSARLRGGNKRCRNDRLLATGYRFKYPTFREGYARLVAEERARGRMMNDE